MTEFHSPVPLPHIPDDLTIPQFFLRTESPGRPIRPRNVPFFIDDASGRAVTYEEAHHRAYGLANALSMEWNIRPGDVGMPLQYHVMSLSLKVAMNYPVAVWAVQILGGIVTPANPSFTADELQHQLSIARAKLIIVHPAGLDTARKAASACGIPDNAFLLLDENKSSLPNVNGAVALGWNKGENYEAVRLQPGEARRTIAFLSFSSGTTGKPKAVAISHYSVIANVIQMAVHNRLDDPDWPDKSTLPGDLAMGVLPFFHIYGLVVIMHYVLYAGGTILIVPKFNFTDFLDSITRYKATHLYLVPPMCVLFCKHPAVKGRDFSHIKFCTSGAAPLGGDLMVQLGKLFPNAAIGQGYGLTETATTVSYLPAGCKMGTVGSSGKLIPGVSAKVVKPDGSLAAEGEPGELVVTGPSMAMGYYDNPAATAETFVDGWVRTGDEVVIKNNEVYILDRIKEIMKVRGFQVAPAELEAHLLAHPYVSDACVVGIPDEYSGEVPMAFVVPSASALSRITKGGASAEEHVKQVIEKHVSDHKINYKWLKGGVEFIDVIPKNPSGKILRRILRDQAKTVKRRAPEIVYRQTQAKL
ncbi:amp dependent CoA ligase [Pholiota conissans]|uniref:Amp dependent CoA ligase n=1 Tax=Pholiota conissans TaxID=109636 RepID=A0A9P5YXL0_9AGAR|nr:amp dependent CoA ligase [Pholiota conissans]